MTRPADAPNFYALGAAVALLLAATIGGCAPRTAELRTCNSRSDRSTCLKDPANCPCEAYGDCGMAGCLAKGEEVQAARDAASGLADVSATASTPETSTQAPVSSPAPPPAVSSCRTTADRNQCSEEPYWCPCDAYGDCGMASCREPQVRPPTIGCRTENDRSVCRTDPARCPCPVGGACGMPGCS